MRRLPALALFAAVAATAAEIPLDQWTFGKDGMARLSGGKLVVEDTSPERSSYASSPGIAVKPKAYYLLTFKASAFSGTNRAALGGVSLEFADAAGKPCGDKNSFSLPFDTRGERDLQLAAQAPADAAKVRIAVRSFLQPMGKLELSSFDLAEVDPRAYQAGRDFVPDYGNDFAVPGKRELAELAAKLPAAPFSPAPPCTDRAFWDQAAKVVERKAEIIARAEAYLKEPFPVVDKALYLAAYDKGMAAYRESFHRRGEMLTCLVLAECLENQGRFRAAIAEWTRAILAEPTWVLPLSDRGKLNIENRGITVDLGSTGRAAMLMTVKRLLPGLLSPEVDAELDAVVKKRVLDPFRNTILSGRIGNGFSWILALNNWGAVCSANIAYSAACMENTPEYNAPIIAGAIFSAQNYLKSFAADGYCSEGVGYWNYGFGHYMLLADTLAGWTGGKIDLFQSPEARRAARFIDRIELHGRRFPAYADCALTNGVKPYNEIAAARFFKCLSYRNPYWINDFLPQCVRAIALLADNNAPPRSTAPAALRDWFELSQVLVSRTPDFSFSAKGGDNNEQHNHNDLGSFVLYSGKTLINCDPGAEVYTMDTFSPNRYRSDLLNSLGHSVPVVAGQLQSPGPKFRAQVLATDFKPECDTLKLDLKGAYEVPELKTLHRTFAFDRAAPSLSVTDRFEFTSPKEFESALVSYEAFTRIDDLHWRIGEGRDTTLLAVTASAPVTTAVTALKAQSSSSKTPANRLAFKWAQPAPEGTITFTFSREKQ